MEDNKEVLDDSINDDVTDADTTEKSELELLKEELDKKHDSLLRTTAEYENFRKRSIKEREMASKTAISYSAEAILPVYDTLVTAISQITDDSTHKKGFELTLKQLEDGFAKLGIEGIEDSVGTPFDANSHAAVMHVDDDSLGENVIAETFQKGFKIGDKIIRHSTVKVAN